MNEMNTYEKVEDLYTNNENSFNILEEEFERSFCIPPSILKDTIKRVLIEAVEPDRQKSFLLNYNFKLKDKMLYYIIIIYFFILSIFSFSKVKNSNVVYDVVFDCWNKYSFDGFYNPIYNKLNFAKIAIFSLVKNYKVNSLFVFDKSNRELFERDISKVIFKTQYNKFKLYKMLSDNTSINFINLSLRLMRYIALYTTDSKNINTKFFISAGDNYYNSIRNHIYHKNGIENIMLIQNGMRGGEQATTSGELYLHCDYYFGFSEWHIKSFHGQIRYEHPVGSFKLYEQTISSNMIDKNNIIDIMFVEQNAPFIEIKNGYQYSAYKKIVEMLCNFSKKHKQYKIVYRTRPLEINSYKNDEKKINEINNLHKKLKIANIIIDDFSNNSYKVLLKSKIIVYYTSTMGIEALGLDKKVLCCNIQEPRLDSVLSNKDEIGTLVESNYALFEEKLLYLLDNDNKEIKEYYLNKKNKFMNLNGSPADKLVNIIKQKMIK